MELVDIILLILGILFISLLLILITFENKIYFDVLVGVASISGFLLTLFDYIQKRKK